MATLKVSNMPLTMGGLEYKDASGALRLLVFQFNPLELKRSRNVSMSEAPVNDKAGSSLEKGTADKKFTLTADKWKIDLAIKIDAATDYSGKPPADATGSRVPGSSGIKRSDDHSQSLLDVQEAIQHLEALVEPIPIPEGNSSAARSSEQAEPPPVRFYWGPRIWSGFVTSLSITEMQFAPTLEPTRIEANIGLTIIETREQLAQKTAGGQAP